MGLRKVAAGMIVLSVVVAVALTATDMVSKAHSAEQDAGIMAKLDKVLAGQEQVMKGLNEIKEELKIIKIRVTQMQ